MFTPEDYDMREQILDELERSEVENDDYLKEFNKDVYGE
jgi:hypothetical protein